MACSGLTEGPSRNAPTNDGTDETTEAQEEEDEPTMEEDRFVEPPTVEAQCTHADLIQLDIAEQGFDHSQPWQKELYSWTVVEQEEALRETPLLLTVGEIPELGKGLAMDLVTEHALFAPASLEAKVNTIFLKFRYAWGVPWATRLGPGSEDYGNRLVKMVLRDEAWVGILNGEGAIIQVVDNNNDDVPLSDALLKPERIAALYFLRDNSSGGPFCGTFSGGSGGYREFIVGNESMLEEWSIGTSEILNRLNQDIAVLSQFAEETRACPSLLSSPDASFNASATCAWVRGGGPYLDALALPSDAYIPTYENLYHLIQTLEEDLFEVDPLVVRPEL